MANIFRSRTAAQLQTHLTNWYAALDAVAAGQSYAITSGGVTRSVTKANMKEIMDMIESLENALQHKQGTAVNKTHIKITKT